jgi:hypothetical protein
LADFEASEQFSPFKKQDGEYVRDDNGKRIPENPKRAALLEDWLWSTLHPDDAMAFGPRSSTSTLNVAGASGHRRQQGHRPRCRTWVN